MHISLFRRIFSKRYRALAKMQRLIPDSWITPEGMLDPKVTSTNEAREMIKAMFGRNDPVALQYLAMLDAIDQRNASDSDR